MKLQKTASPLQFSPLSIARIVWKQKLWIVLTWAAVAAAGIAIVMRLPAVYHAETLILVDSQKIPERYVAATVSSDLQDRLATISQEILSSSRLKQIIQDFDLYHDLRQTKSPEEIIELMRQDVEVKLERGWANNRPGAFRISYQGPTAQLVADVANRLASLYIDANLKVRENQAEGTSEFIEHQLDEAKRQLDELEAKVSRYKLEHNGELPQQENALIGTMGRLQVELQGAQDSANRAQQSKLMLDASLHAAENLLDSLTPAEQPVESADSGVTAAPSGSAPAPRKRSEALAAQLELLRSRYGDDHPDMRRLRGEIAALQLAEASEAQASANAVAAAPGKQDGPTVPAAPRRRTVVQPARDAEALARARERIDSIKVQIRLADDEIQKRAADRERIIREINECQAQIRRLPVREQEMAALTRDYDMSKANYRSLLDKKLAAGMATDMERRQKAERFTVLDSAFPPAKPFKPHRGVLAAMSGLIGLALGVVLGVGKELRTNTILGEWELPAGVPVLGRIPRIRFTAPRKRWLPRPWRIGFGAATAILLVLGAFFAWQRF